MKKLTLSLTIAYFIAIIALPCCTVFGYYDVLANGEAYKIRISGYDPYDPFRGRYIEIRPDLSSLRWADAPIILLKDADGFVIDTVTSPSGKGAGYIGKFKLNGYYMNEEIAPAAERAIINALNDENNVNNVYVTIKVKNGRFAVEGMYINDIPIEQYI